MSWKNSAATKIEAAMLASDEPLTIDQICKAALGRVGARERALVRVNLHRLDQRGILTKHAARYSLNPASSRS